VLPGAVIHTDGWKGYGKLSSLGYTHEVVRPAAEVGGAAAVEVEIVGGHVQRDQGPKVGVEADLGADAIKSGLRNGGITETVQPG